MSSPIQVPTQVSNGARATIRTVFAVVVSLLTLIPVVLLTSGVNETALGAQVLAVTAVITRVLALPQVNQFIEDYLPFLAARPSTGKHAAE